MYDRKIIIISLGYFVFEIVYLFCKNIVLVVIIEGCFMVVCF